MLCITLLLCSWYNGKRCASVKILTLCHSIFRNSRKYVIIKNKTKANCGYVFKIKIIFVPLRSEMININRLRHDTGTQIQEL